MKHRINKNTSLLIALMITFGSLFFSQPTLAAPKKLAQADPEKPATSSATTEELKKRIEKVVEQQREQIKGVLEDLLVKKAGYVGEITRISSEALTVKTQSTTAIIPLSEELVILQENKPLEVGKIEVGNWAVVIGDKDDELVEAEYVLVSEESLRPRNQLVVLATIKTINRSQLVIVPRGSEEERTLTISKTTKFQDNNGDAATAADFEPDFNVLVIGLENTDGWELKTVRSLAPLQADE